jgi:hypothetical protein
MVYTCNSGYLEGRDQEDGSFEPNLGKKFRSPHLQNNQSKMDWKYGLSCRACFVSAKV